MKDNWEGKRVMVTGANGFLASWITEKLLSKKANVWSLIYEDVPLSLFNLNCLEKKTHVINGDIRDFRMIEKLIKDFDLELIFHIGAQAINKTAIDSPFETLETNIRGTYNILEAVRTTSPETKIIIASSDKAYGIHGDVPYNENFSLHGEYPYEVSKSCADLISSAYYNTYNLPICIVRSCNIYGGGDWHFSRVVPATIINIKNNHPPILISETKRDYIYADDVAEGYIKLAEAMFKGLKGEAFNFGNGQPIETSKLLKMILKIMDKEELGIVKSEETRLEIPIQYLSIDKAREMIGFTPKTKLEDGLKETINWYVKYSKDITQIKLED